VALDITGTVALDITGTVALDIKGKVALDITSTVALSVKIVTICYFIQLAIIFVQSREVLGFHSCINELNFLLLYEATLLGEWLQTFRQTVRA